MDVADLEKRGMFRSLRIYNYRMWAAGALVSNIGTWMQRTAQDWLVLTELTHHNATAVGITMALQFGPQVVLLPVTGWAADHLDRRELLAWTQGTMGALALGLGVLTIGGWVRLWEVYCFALALGCASAMDAPARQTFVSELVGEKELSNAVALNSTSFNAARMVGPAAAGLMIAAVSTGWVFLINGASFGAVLVSLWLIRTEDLSRGDKRPRSQSHLMEGFRYVWERRQLKAAMLMLGLVGTLGLNFPIFISTMCVTVFHVGASHYGVLSSVMAIGSVAGALVAAKRDRPGMGLLIAGSAAFGAACGVAAVMPNVWAFGAVLMVVGLAALTFTTSINSMIQMSTEPGMRGRVMAIMLAIAVGGTMVGAPAVGWVADRMGPRWALGIAGVAGVASALVGVGYLVSAKNRQPRG